MEQLPYLSGFFLAIENDPRIGIRHIGIYAALLQYWSQNQYANPLQAFSYEIMKIAKISGSNTYIRCIRELSDYGYIFYQPSFEKLRVARFIFSWLNNLDLVSPIHFLVFFLFLFQDIDKFKINNFCYSFF